MSTLADDDFDRVLRQRCSNHLSTVSPAEAATKRWRSGYWGKWFTALNLSDYSELGNGGDVFVSETEDDADEGLKTGLRKWT